MHCRPDSSKAYEGLGDYYSAANDRVHARQFYLVAVQRDADDDSAKTELAQISNAP